MENKISPTGIFKKWKETLLSDISPTEWPYVQRLLNQSRRSVATNLYWLQPFYEVFVPELAVPKDTEEAKDFDSIGILSMPWCLHQAGITLDELSKEVSQGLQGVLSKEGGKLEARLSKIEKDTAEFSLWLDNRMQAMAGSLVDLYFFRYKRYRPVSGARAGDILESLKEAGQRSLVTGVFRHLKDHAHEIGVEPLLPLLERDWDFEKPLQTIGPFSAVWLPCQFDLYEVIAARLTGKKSGIRGLLEEKLCNGISEDCQRLVEMMERYSDYSPRTMDPSLAIVQFNPKQALWLNIIEEAKKSRRTMTQLCIEAVVDVQEVRNFKRRLDYALQKQLEIPR